VGSRPSLHLHVEGTGPLHVLAPQAKLVGLFVFALATVAVPIGNWPVLLGAVALGGLLVLLSGVGWRHVAPRLLIEVPFLVFALVLPFVATGPRVAVGPFELSEPGLLAAGTLAAKGTAAVLAATAFSVTTSARDLVVGLQRLRLPTTLVAILSFMVRYVSVVTDEFTRMRIARESRGFRARSLRTWPVLGRSLGTLFVRSYERGERVHLAMTSRGWSGGLPLLDESTVPLRHWVLAFLPAAVVLVALTASRVIA
jgi:cobalt/nickel transport system permease protein